MKVKELERFVHAVWSPPECIPLLLATISADDGGQESHSQWDSDGGSRPALLELFPMDFRDPSLDVKHGFSAQVDQKSTCICWSRPNSSLSMGLLISGCSSGSIILYNPEALLNTQHGSDCSVCFEPSIGNSSGLLCNIREGVHTGPVRGLDANRFQTNLFASVADEAEVYIWDIEKMEYPMSPGQKSQPNDSITTVAWNPRVQHILATAGAGQCTVWDLRKSDPVVHLTKAMCQFEPQLMVWSPDTATKLCLADPTHPSADLQLWDLRYPKHTLALIGRWPPTASGPLGHAALGNAATVNALAWSPAGAFPVTSRRPGLSLHDEDLIAVSLTASGALPSTGGGWGSNLQPISADFLVVWSVDEALKTVQQESNISAGCGSSSLQPLFVGRLEGRGEEDAPNSITSGGLPSNAAIHWLPGQPSLVSVIQPDGWIGVYSLSHGGQADGLLPVTRLRSSTSGDGACSAHSPRFGRMAASKVAEAFGEEIDLGGTAASCGSVSPNSLISGTNFSPLDGQLDKRVIASLPQPLPLLRLAPRWMKKRCGASFCFGGRLVSFFSPPVSTRHIRNFSQSNSRSLRTLSGGGSNLHPHLTEDELPTTDPGTSVVITWHSTAANAVGDGPPSVAKPDRATGNSDLVQRLTEAVSVPLEELHSICERLAGISDNRFVFNIPLSSKHMNSMNLLQTRLKPNTDLKVSLSHLLNDEDMEADNIETSLNTMTVSEVDCRCSCQLQTDASLTDAVLRALKMSLARNDIATAVRLCLHRQLYALTTPGISPLSSFALLLMANCQHLQSTIYPEIRQTLLSSLMSGLPTHALPQSIVLQLTAIRLLFSAVLCDDWLSLAQEWPLIDWSTGLLAVVLHTWERQDGLRLRYQLCGILSDRLLEFDGDAVLSSDQANAAAWACSVVSLDLPRLAAAWFRVTGTPEDSTCDDKVLPLSVQLVLTLRCLLHESGDNYSSWPESTCLASLLPPFARWLAFSRAGHSESDALLTLRLLQLLPARATTSSPYSELSSLELMHRLWCGLPLEAQQQLQSTGHMTLICPYQSTGTNRHVCPCGFGYSVMSPSVSQLAQPLAGYQHQQSDRRGLPPSSSRMYTPQLGPGEACQLSLASAPVPPICVPPIQMSAAYPTPPAGPDGMQHPTQPLPGFSHLSPSYGAAASALQPALPPPSRFAAPTLNPVAFPPLEPTNFRSVQPTNTWMPSLQHREEFQRQSSSPGGPLPPLSPVGAITGNMSAPVSSMSPPAGTPGTGVLSTVSLPPTRAWNDPPVLAKAYQAPVRSTVTVNNFYNPCDFVCTSAATPMPPSSSVPPTHYPPAMPTGVSPGFVASQATLPPSSKPPQQTLVNSGAVQPGPTVANTTGPQQLLCVTPPLLPLPPLPVSHQQQPLGTGMYSQAFPPCASSGGYSIAVADQQQQAHVLPHELPHLRPPKSSTPSLLGNANVAPAAPMAYDRHLSAEQWPAAEPLGCPNMVTGSDRDGDVCQVQSYSSRALKDGSANGQINLESTEYQSLETSLRNLVAMCRNAGGKMFSAKMDSVERRLNSLFVALRAGSLSDATLLAHLRDCVAAAEAGDYFNAVSCANSLIQSATGFEAIHGFAPGLKILMHSAKQLFSNA